MKGTTVMWENGCRDTIEGMKTKDGVILKAIPISPNDDYMAGDDGRIYSRTKYAGFGRKDYVDWYPLVGHVTSKKGYQTISMCHQNKKVSKSVHRLVCMAFHGIPPHKNSQVRHLDGNTNNNRPANVIWGTQEENWQDRKIHAKTWTNANYKFTPEEREHIKWALDMGLCSQHSAARKLGCSQSSIYEIFHSKGGAGNGSRINLDNLRQHGTLFSS